MTDLEITSLPDADLEALLDAARSEYQRRRNLAATIEADPDLAVAVMAVQGNEPGDPWTQPLGSFDAYPQDWEVTHDGKQWVSLIPANTYEPGVSGWREVTASGAPAEWVQPSGAHDAYMKGDQVTYEGETWTSSLDHNVYRPGEFGWTNNEGDNQ